MSKIEELEARLVEMQAELEALKAEKAASEWPQDDDRYWIVGSGGDVTPCVWAGDSADESFLAHGGIFRTKEEAEAEAEARKVVAELRRQPGARRFVAREYNWTIAYSHRSNLLEVYDWEIALALQQSVWFDSKESARAAVKSVGGDRIIKAARWWALGEC